MTTSYKKMLVLTCLYLAQGLPFGFFTQALPSLLRQQNISLETIGFGSVLVLPWALKWLWAPFVDRFGDYRFWIIPMNCSAALVLLLMSSIPIAALVNEKLVWLFTGFFLLNLCAATQDIATDGWAVTILSEAERGIGNGIQVAGYRVGMIIGGGFLLFWFTHLGWMHALWILAAVLLLTTLPILFYKNTPPHLREPVTYLSIKSFFQLKNIRYWILVLVFYKLGDAFAATMVRPLLIDYGLTLDDIAKLLGTAGFIAGLLGALVGGALVNYLGRHRALFLFMLLQASTMGCYGLITLGFDSKAYLYVFAISEHFFGGMATAALFTVMMDHCRQNHAANDYTLQACIVVLVSIIAASLSGISAEFFGYAVHYILATALAFLTLPCLLLYFQRFSGDLKRVKDV